MSVINTGGPDSAAREDASLVSSSSSPSSFHTAPKLWGGRFTGATDPVFEKYNSSISFDRQLWKADIKGSQGYARALADSHTISAQEAEAIVEGLQRVAEEWQSDEFQLRDSDEDIHTANERRLGELIGMQIAGKLHTGRSRNDQVATDVRLYLLDEISVIQQELVSLVQQCCNRAYEEVNVLMPGFTHLQPAQPVRWSHWLLSYATAFQRDAQRVQDVIKRVSVSPLGSGALAGNPFGIDRVKLGLSLGFLSVSPNSMDAVCDRDFVAEFLFFATMTMTHISQISEDLIIWSSRKFVILADAYSTGSSLMPQKKNPDALELLRGKTGRVTGSLMTLLILLKSLPRAYNKDLQEDKEPLFDAVSTVHASLQILAGVISTLRIDANAMHSALVPEMLATDLAEYLVRRGVPFRATHHVAGAAVKLAEDRKCSMFDLTLRDLQTLHPSFQADVLQVWDYERSVESRNVRGGTSKSSQLTQIAELGAWCDEYLSSLHQA